MLFMSEAVEVGSKGIVVEPYKALIRNLIERAWSPSQQYTGSIRIIPQDWEIKT